MHATSALNTLPSGSHTQAILLAAARSTRPALCSQRRRVAGECGQLGELYVGSELCAQPHARATGGGGHRSGAACRLGARGDRRVCRGGGWGEQRGRAITSRHTGMPAAARPMLNPIWLSLPPFVAAQPCAMQLAHRRGGNAQWKVKGAGLFGKGKTLSVEASKAIRKVRGACLACVCVCVWCVYQYVYVVCACVCVCVCTPCPAPAIAPARAVSPAARHRQQTGACQPQHGKRSEHCLTHHALPRWCLVCRVRRCAWTLHPSSWTALCC